MKKTIILIILIVVGASIVYYFERKNDNGIDGEVVTKSEPTNFVKSGVVTFNNPGQKEGVPYLVYESDGSSTTKELIFDALSFCSFENGSAPCMALSVTLDMPLNGKRVIVDGNEQGNIILVRKIRALLEGEEARLYEPGNVFVSWPEAVKLINECQVDLVTQTHALDIYLRLKDDSQLRTVEPQIDSIFPITQAAMETCGSIGVATE